MGMEMVAGWGTEAIQERLATLTDRLADGLRPTGVALPRTHLRAPHILCAGFPKGMPEGLLQRLAAEKVFAAQRLGRIRISPHVYNDEADVDRFVAVFSRLLA